MSEGLQGAEEMRNHLRRLKDFRVFGRLPKSCEVSEHLGCLWTVRGQFGRPWEDFRRFWKALEGFVFQSLGKYWKQLRGLAKLWKKYGKISNAKYENISISFSLHLFVCHEDKYINMYNKINL